MITKYAVGFCFDDDRRNVVLIRKKRPDWQAGKLNGVGGHVEDFDKSAQWAMAREFHEETGVMTRPEDWTHFATLLSQRSDVQVFKTVDSKFVNAVRTVTDEHILVLPPHVAYPETVPNLKFLIPMAMNLEPIKPVTIEYLQ